MRRFIPPLVMRLADKAVDSVVRNLDARIREIVAVSILGGKKIEDVELEDATATAIQHGLGHKALVFVSPPRGASTSGRIEEIRSGDYDSRNVVALKATGFGTTVTIDLWVS